MNIYYVNFPSGMGRVTHRHEVSQKVLALVTPWFGGVLRSGERKPLVLPAVSHFSASADEKEHMLLGTLWAPSGPYRPERPHPGPVMELTTFGVASDDAGGERLWANLSQRAGGAAHDPPRAPWCAAFPDSAGMSKHPKSALWLTDLQCSLAFAWLASEKHPDAPRVES